MRYFSFIYFFLFPVACVAQKKTNPQTDLNTFYICIDSTTYQNLSKNSYLKDTLFICRISHQETNIDSYTGTYFIGESAILEFLQPKPTGDQPGDHFGEWGIEFKTRKLGILNARYGEAKNKQYRIDTATIIANFDSLQIAWYKTLSLKTATTELSILEYQAPYLESIGLTKDQMNKSLSFKQFYQLLSNGKKYPRQFSMITYLKLYVDSTALSNLKQFASLNRYQHIGTTFTNGETTIEYKETKVVPTFPIIEIGLSLLTPQPSRTEKISEHLELKVNGKRARLNFRN